MRNMLTEKKIRYINVSLNDLNQYRGGAPFRKIDDDYLLEFFSRVKTIALSDTDLAACAAIRDIANVEQYIEPTEEGEEAPVSSISLNQPDPLSSVTFFYVSDLIDVILKYMGTMLEIMPDEMSKIENVDEDLLKEETETYRRYAENFAKFRVLLGPIEIVEANAEGEIIQSEFFNIGDIPISAKYFMEWMTNKVLKKGSVVYTLTKFLNDFFNDFLYGFLNKDTCYGNRAKQKVRFNEASVTAYNEFAEDGVSFDEITYLCRNAESTRLEVSSTAQRPILNVMGKRDSAVPDGGFENQRNYLVFFAARTQPTELMQGDRDEDHKRGIWHYQIGKDQGIVKTITLSKTESPGLAEARFEQEGYDGLQQLRVVYDATIKTFLDVSAYPGTYIYVEPKGFSPSAENLTQFGIGGYYMVYRSAHTFGPGLAESELSAKWVAEIARAQEEVATVVEESAIGKCDEFAAAREAKAASVDAQADLEAISTAAKVASVASGGAAGLAAYGATALGKWIADEIAD
jgi:hypothetical protein